MSRRSLLFAPGDRPEMMRNATEAGADGVIFDLEDAVAPEAKDDAREAVREMLADVDADVEVCVRANPIDGRGRGDVETVGPTDGLDTLVVPMVDGPADVRAAAAALDEAGAPGVGVVPLVETAPAVLSAPAIARESRVTGVAFGAEDFRAAMGASPLPGGEELLYARQRVVTAATAADVDAIDTVYTDIDDREGLAEEASYALGLGFDGKAAIHPDQVAVINDAFTPDPEEVSWAERVIEAERRAADRDAGVFTVDGEMVDEPVVERARSVLRRAGRAADLDIE